jgi:four helix bundle protein
VWQIGRPEAFGMRLNGGSLSEKIERKGRESRTLAMFGFEKLAVWKESVQYAGTVYSLTKSFPVEERFGLTSQMRRSAVSLSANLAEVTSRITEKDFARLVEIAYGSLMENISEATIAREQRFLSEEDIQNLYLSAEKLARMLSGLRASLLSAKHSTPISQPSTSA